MSLPFLFCVGLLLQSGVCLRAQEKAVPVFQKIESTCIDLANYDAKAQLLTTRFVGDTNQFYCYSRVPKDIWDKIISLNGSGSVGTFFKPTVVEHREKYPFEKIRIWKFKTLPVKRKAGDSK